LPDCHFPFWPCYAYFQILSGQTQDRFVLTVHLVFLIELGNSSVAFPAFRSCLDDSEIGLVLLQLPAAEKYLAHLDLCLVADQEVQGCCGTLPSFQAGVGYLLMSIFYLKELLSTVHFLLPLPLLRKS
jgi:hypothetical protein